MHHTTAVSSEADRVRSILLMAPHLSQACSWWDQGYWSWAEQEERKDHIVHLVLLHVTCRVFQVALPHIFITQFSNCITTCSHHFLHCIGHMLLFVYNSLYNMLHTIHFGYINNHHGVFLNSGHVFSSYIYCQCYTYFMLCSESQIASGVIMRRDEDQSASTYIFRSLCWSRSCARCEACTMISHGFSKHHSLLSYIVQEVSGSLSVFVCYIY